MFSKLFNKLQNHQQQRCPQNTVTLAEVNPRVALHYGIPANASILAFDHVQRLLAVGTQDGRIKVIGGDNIEGLFISPKQSPIKSLEFLQNQGFLASVSKDNEIQVWDLEHREIASTLRWESTITAFSIIYATPYMYVGSEYGTVSILKFDSEERNIIFMPYYVPSDVISGTIGMSSLDQVSVVKILPQPCSQGNRMLIAYENGLLVLWDAYVDQIILIRGHKCLEVKNDICNPKNKTDEHSDDNEEVEKEISSVCWASLDGSILAVGYVDGDIILWDLSSDSANKDQPKDNWSNHIFKLKLSSGERRIPITALHSSEHRSTNGRGQLFVYGGDEVGSEEVLTILSLDWSSGIKCLKCTSHNKFTVNGAFADMVLISSDGSMKGDGTMFFLLTNPGQLHLYDNACLSSFMNKQEKNNFSGGLSYTVLVPTFEPYIKIAKLSLVPRNAKSSKFLSEMVSASKLNQEHSQTSKGTTWPLTSGVPSSLLKTEEYQINRLYMAGYQDGSVRVWDATYPALSLIYILGLEVKDSDIAGVGTSVSAIEFCSDSLQFAIGKECGLVQLYELTPSEESSLHLVTETTTEVKNINQDNGPSCKAIFSLLNSSVCILKFTRCGARLAAGYECGRVAMLDVVTLSVLFLTESISSSNSAVVSMDMKFSETCSSLNSPEISECKNFESEGQGLCFIMTRDARIFVVDDVSGKVITNAAVVLKKEMTLISICIIEEDSTTCELSNKLSMKTNQSNDPKGERAENANAGNTSAGVENINSAESSYVAETISKLLLVVCCENDLSIYPLKSLIEGRCEPTWNMNLVNQCIWTTSFKKDERECGLVALYRTGAIEIRTLPTLEIVGESSLGSSLRWNLETDMKDAFCSSSYGQIVLINRKEIAFISLLAYENEFRIPESLPCLHDKVLAASADTTARLSPIVEETRGSASDFWTRMKNFRNHNIEQKAHEVEVIVYDVENLERLFSSPPFLKPWMDKENDLGFSMDDIQIDEPLVISSKVEKKENGTERERLFEGTSTDTKPRARTIDEIKAKYGKAGTGDVAAVAKEARNKLLERQEKLQKLSDHSEELKDEAEDFASLAGELAKRMQNRKWWQL